MFLPTALAYTLSETVALQPDDVAAAMAALAVGATRRHGVGHVNGRTFANGFGLGPLRRLLAR